MPPRKKTEAPDPELLQEIAGRLLMVDETLSDLRDELRWIVNNRHELPQAIHISRMAKDNEGLPPDKVSCSECPEEMDGLAQALRDGWEEPTRKDDGTGYWCLCPGCYEEHCPTPPKQPEPRFEHDDEPGQKSLFS